MLIVCKFHMRQRADAKTKRQYQVPAAGDDMEEEAQAVEDRTNLTHGGIWYEVYDEDEEHPPYLYFAGDFGGCSPPKIRTTETRSDKEVPSMEHRRL